MTLIATVDVTAEDISEGIPGRIALCPIARAVTRAINRPTMWGFWGGVIHDDKGRARCEAVEHADQSATLSFVQRFDARLPVEPFRFTLKVIDSETGANDVD